MVITTSVAIRVLMFIGQLVLSLQPFIRPKLGSPENFVGVEYFCEKIFRTINFVSCTVKIRLKEHQLIL